ncbi:unnamed protein product [Pichia kudriavzevii]
MARIGPNPYITEVARHVPRVGAWAGVMVLFFGWPMVGKYTQRAGVWNPYVTYFYSPHYTTLHSSANMARIGPNPYVVEIAKHIPRMGGWAGAMVLFFGWPMLGKYTQKAGLWGP